MADLRQDKQAAEKDKHSIPKAVLIWLTIVVLGFSFGLYLIPIEDRKSQYATAKAFENWQAERTSKQVDGKSAETPRHRDYWENIFKERLGHYRGHLEDLSSNLFYQLLANVIAVVIVISRLKNFTIPVIEQTVRAEFVYLSLPLCLLFLWAQFGYLLNTLIDERMALWTLAEALEPLIESAKGLEKPNDGLWHQFLSTFSVRPELHDGAYMNGWFICFLKEYTFNAPESGIQLWVIRVLMVCFGLFLGISHGCVFGLILRSYARFGAFKRHLAYLICSGMFFFATHAAFYGVGNRNWLQPWILLSAATVTLGFCVLPLTAKGKIVPNPVPEPA